MICTDEVLDLLCAGIGMREAVAIAAHGSPADLHAITLIAAAFEPPVASLAAVRLLDDWYAASCPCALSEYYRQRCLALILHTPLPPVPA